MRLKNSLIWNMAGNNQKRGKRNEHCRTWNMARNLKIMENEKHTRLEVKYGEEQGEGGK
jgi:hypothetical protein